MDRKLPIGAETQPDGGSHFRVWVPDSKVVALELYASDGKIRRVTPLTSEPDGYFSNSVPDAPAGTLYKFRIDSGSFPDPASRFQPEGPHGPSQVIDPAAFRWTDQNWKGLSPKDLVLYELHLGTFTPEGTWRAAIEQLPELRRIGITALEIMPIAEFPGRFGWGYDGVDLFAPTRLYGSPEDARAFVNRAHELGFMVILDVVYNHVGPDGNYLANFAQDYFSKSYSCEWGDPLNFDGKNSKSVREFFISNARYWIEEFHFDGLRLDATQAIHDRSEPHLLAEISTAARAAGHGRNIYLVGENEPQRTKLIRPQDQLGYGLDALWNDDFHHSAMVAATGRREAYYLDYKGSPQEFISAIKYGFLYQGQLYSWQKARRGTPALDLPAKSFVIFLQNHDQIANTLYGQRLHQVTSPGKLRTLVALTLLGPATPMLFQGEEFSASQPFHYFADHNPELNKMVSKGRGDFLRQFRTIASPECRHLLKAPADLETFNSCKLDFSERQRHQSTCQLYTDLLRSRREDPVIRDPEFVDGAVLSADAFVLRYFSPRNDDRILLVNFGADLHLHPCPEPLLAPRAGQGWTILWSSENPAYGGTGTPPLETAAGWIIPGPAAILLKPDENNKLPNAKLSQNH